MEGADATLSGAWDHFQVGRDRVPADGPGAVPGATSHPPERMTMGKESKKKTPIAAAQREITRLATDAERLLRRFRELGEELDEPLTQAQAQGLEPERLTTYVAAWLLTSVDSPLDDIPARLMQLAELRQEDVDRAWKDRLPVTLAEAMSRRLDRLTEAVEAVLAAASEDNGRRLAMAVEVLCRQVESGGAELNDLAALGRRYLAPKG